MYTNPYHPNYVASLCIEGIWPLKSKSLDPIYVGPTPDWSDCISLLYSNVFPLFSYFIQMYFMTKNTMVQATSIKSEIGLRVNTWECNYLFGFHKWDLLKFFV